MTGRARMAVVVLAGLAGTGLAGPGIAGEGPERLWWVQTESSTAQNAGAVQMQAELVNQLRRVQVDVPEGMVMSLEQISRLNALFALKEDVVSTRDEAKQILGLQ